MTTTKNTPSDQTGIKPTEVFKPFETAFFGDDTPRDELIRLRKEKKKRKKNDTRPEE